MLSSTLNRSLNKRTDIINKMDNSEPEKSNSGKNIYRCYSKSTGKDYGFVTPKQRVNNLESARPRPHSFTSRNYNTRFEQKRYFNNIPPRDQVYEERLFVKRELGINFDSYFDIPVTVNYDKPSAPMETFKCLELGEVLKLNVELCGYDKPTPIQKYGIPCLMNGLDMMACAQTGSGKTAAYLLPLVHQIYTRVSTQGFFKSYADNPEPFALVLAPTRELVQQIETEARKFCYRTGIRVVSIYGGVSIQGQRNALLSGCEILVATPGRLIDIIQRFILTLKDCKILVFDEADRMLDMGFEPQIRTFLTTSKLPDRSERHTVMFSATFPSRVRELAETFLKDHVKLSVGRVGSACDHIEQKIMFVPDQEKRERLLTQIKEIRENDPQSRILVFVDRKNTVDEVEYGLYRSGHRVVSIHGDRSQLEREEALALFKLNQANVMVATDVAQRGLDIPNVTHVINFSFPNDMEDYVHRIGRTGRAGNFGQAITFFNDTNSSFAGPLIKVLNENKQEVPPFLNAISLSFRPRNSGSTSSRGRSSFYRKSRGNGSSSSYSHRYSERPTHYSTDSFPDRINDNSWNDY